MDDGILESLLRELEAEVEAEAELIDQQTRHIFSSVPRPSGSSSLATEGHPYRPIIPYRMDGKLRKAAEQVPIHMVTFPHEVCRYMMSGHSAWL